MNKEEFLRLHQPFLKNGELNQSFESDLNLLLEQYAQQVREDEAIAFVMWFEQDEKSTSKFAYKIEYKRFKNHQNQQ